MGNHPDHYDHRDQSPLATILSNFRSEESRALMELSLSDFEQGTYVVKVRSALLGEDIYFVSNERLLEKVPEGFAVYTAKELRALRCSTKAQLKRIHWTKKEFDGEVIE